MNKSSIKATRSGDFTIASFDLTPFISGLVNHLDTNNVNVEGIALFSLSMLSVSLMKCLKMPEIKPIQPEPKVAAVISSIILNSEEEKEVVSDIEDGSITSNETLFSEEPEDVDDKRAEGKSATDIPPSNNIEEKVTEKVLKDDLSSSPTEEVSQVLLGGATSYTRGVLRGASQANVKVGGYKAKGTTEGFISTQINSLEAAQKKAGKILDLKVFDLF